MPSPLARLTALTADCADAAEYEAARLAWLHEVVPCDTIYQGAVSRHRNFAPLVSNVPVAQTAACEARGDRYWADRDRLHGAAERAGGVAVDLDVLDRRTRARSVFYREVMDVLGVRATAVAVLRARGELRSCIWFGRTARGARFRDVAALDLVREALPVLALGDLVHPSTRRAPETFDLGLTPREKDVTRYLARGLTNAEIAGLLGSSPATVKNQIAAILRKTGTSNRTELAWLVRGAAAEDAAPASRRRVAG